MAVVGTVVPNRFTVEGKQVPYMRTHPLGTAAPLVTQAVLVVHGAGKNADGYFDYASDAVTLSGRSLTNVAVIAPQFLEDEDVGPHGINTATHHYWSNGWRGGDYSLNGTTSSYEVLDYIITRLMDVATFPNLTRITVTGHSAGGQVTGRYCGAGINPRAGVLIKYVIANPSSYLYLTQERPVGRSVTNFAIPTGVSEGTYNNYQYGLRNLNSHMASIGTNQIRTNFADRDIDVILGESDTLQDSDLDTSTPATYQGFNRFERGQAWFNHLVRQVGQGKHDLWTVPGVGHSGGGMYRSVVGRNSLFDFDVPPEVEEPPPQTLINRYRASTRAVWGRNDRWGGSLASRRS